MHTVGNKYVVSAQDLTLAGGHLVSIDQVQKLDEVRYLLRISLQFPVPEGSAIPAREYVDSRGKARRVNAGGFRGVVIADRDFPGYDVLCEYIRQGYTGNVGLRGTERLFLLPTHERSGLVFEVEMRTNPQTGDEVPGLARICPVNLRIGPLTGANTFVPDEGDLAEAQALIDQVLQPAQPVQPTKPTMTSAPTPAATPAPSAARKPAAWDGLF